MSEGPSNRRQAEQQLIERAATDAAFRAQLLENPRQALQQEFGVPISENIAIRVLEEQPDEAILVLPAQHTQHGAELSDQELERVAGGTATSPAVGTCFYC
jgi:hypothetical protein